MPALPTHPMSRLSRLRQIGWTLWDPIGLLPTATHCRDAENLPFADEYDTYLLHAAGLLRSGAADAEVASFLIDIEANHMGLGEQRDARARAESAVAALRAAGLHPG